MKNVLILVLCFYAQITIGQVIITENVEKQYDHVVKHLLPKYQQSIKKSFKEFNNNGITLFTVYKIDTLNKNDFVNKGKSKVTITSINLTGGKKIKLHVKNTESEDTNIPVPCGAVLNGDTLFIEIPYVFAPFISHKIANGKLMTTYEEYEKRDTIYRLNLLQPKTERLSIPTKSPLFKLNTTSFKAGQLLYGEGEIITADYYVDDPGFTSKYIHKRLHCKYVFKAIITHGL